MDGVKFAEEATKRFERAYDAESTMRREMLEDLEFSFAINQWDEDVRAERQREKRPCLTIDRMGDTVRKLMGGIRKKNMALKVSPVEDGDDETTSILNDLLRSIEYNSHAESVYMTAAEYAIRMGRGVIGVEAVDTDDVWSQDLRIVRYINPFSVYWDPQATELTKRDAAWCFESEWMSADEFAEKWPDAEVPGGDAVEGERDELWWEDGRVRVMRYWTREMVESEVLMLSDGRTVAADDLRPEDESLLVVAQKRVMVPEIKRAIVTKSQTLEGPDVWPGRWIPVVAVHGEEMAIEGRLAYRGIIRTAKDPQRMYNYARTTSAEIMAEQPRAPWLIGFSQITDGIKSIWNRANQAKLPYLPYDDTKNGTPPQRQPPPVASQGYLAEMQVSSDDIQRATGVFDPSLGQRSNETSGRAILARQEGADDGVMVFIDHLSEAIEQVGRVIVDLIPRYYDTNRTLRLVGEDGAERSEQINRKVLTPDGPVVKNDLSRGRYDVRVTIGTSYASRRIEAANSMVQFLQVFPQAGPLVADLVAKNMDWPSADEFATRLRGMVPPGVIDEDDPQKAQQQAAEMQMQQDAIATQQALQKAEIIKMQAEVGRLESQTMLDKAKIADLLAGREVV